MTPALQGRHGHSTSGTRPLASGIELSVVIVARNEGANLQRTVGAFQRTVPAASEIVVVDDGSIDGGAEPIVPSALIRTVRTNGIGVTRARNHGAVLGAGRFVLFADAHVEPQPGWWPSMRKALSQKGVGAVAPVISVMGRPDVRGYGLCLAGPDMTPRWLGRNGASPYRVPLLPGCFLAMSRETWRSTGGFDDGMRTWGLSDIELSIRLWMLGFELWLVPNTTVAHLFRSKHPYLVDWISVLHNTLRTAFVHFGPSRTERVVDAVKQRSDFAAALALVASGDYARRREVMLEHRRHDDDWYFSTFGASI